MKGEDEELEFDCPYKDVYKNYPKKCYKCIFRSTQINNFLKIEIESDDDKKKTIRYL